MSGWLVLPATLYLGFFAAASRAVAFPRRGLAFRKPGGQAKRTKVEQAPDIPIGTSAGDVGSDHISLQGGLSRLTRPGSGSRLGHVSRSPMPTGHHPLPMGGLRDAADQRRGIRRDERKLTKEDGMTPPDSTEGSADQTGA